jgi:hypothetical protein
MKNTKSNKLSKAKDKAIEVLEAKIDEMLRNRRVLLLLSKNINTAIKVQTFATKRLELVLRIADIPTLKGLNELFESVNHLEKESMKQKERILQLEEQLEASKAKTPIRKRKNLESMQM